MSPSSPSALLKHGFRAGALHGDMDQSARTASLDAFKTGEIDILVAPTSRRAASTFPMSAMSSISTCRSMPTITSTASAAPAAPGAQRHSVTLITTDDLKHLQQIQDLIKKQIDWRGPALDELPPPEHTERDRARVSRSRERRGGGGRGERPERERPARAVERPARAVERPERAVERPERAVERPERVERERPERGRRERVAAEETRPPHEKPVREPREARAPRRREREDDGPAVVGFGDHLPGFLMRPVKVKAKRAD